MSEEKRLKARVVHKHKTEAEWRLDVYDESGKLRDNPFVPLNGELIIFDPDQLHLQRRFKTGDGVANVMDLPFNTQSYDDLLNKPEIPSIEGLATESYVDNAIDSIPLANGVNTAGLIKTSSGVFSTEGYTACPVINGVPYYKQGATPTGAVQSDYEENDSTSGAYILNRPFYEGDLIEKRWVEEPYNPLTGKGYDWTYPHLIGYYINKYDSSEYQIYAELITTETITPEKMVGGMAYYHYTGQDNFTYNWILEEKDLVKSENGFYFVEGGSLEYGEPVIVCAYNTNYMPFGIALPKPGVYACFLSAPYDSTYVDGVAFSYQELKQLDNKFIDLKNHPDFQQGAEAIIDCAILPTSNINANIIYRTNDIQFVFDRQVGTEGGVPVNVIVVEDVTKLQHAEIMPYATSNPTARNWYYDLSRQHGYCHYNFTVDSADKNNSRYDWIDKAATSGYQWFDPEWIYRNQKGYGGTVSSYDEIPTSGYKTIYFISKTSLFYYDSNIQKWIRLQEGFVNNTNYDVVPTIMRKSDSVSYKTYTDGLGASTIALRTSSGQLRGRTTTSGAGSEWDLNKSILVNVAYLDDKLANFEGGVSEERVSQIVDSEIDSRNLISASRVETLLMEKFDALDIDQYTTESEVDNQIDSAIEALDLSNQYEPKGAEQSAKEYTDNKFEEASLDQYVKFTNNLGYSINKYETYLNIEDEIESFKNDASARYIKISNEVFDVDTLYGKIITKRQHANFYDMNSLYDTKLKIGSAELAKAKNYTGGTYLYDLGIWLVKQYDALGSVNPGFTSNGTYFVMKINDGFDENTQTQFDQILSCPIEVGYEEFKQIDSVYTPKHHIVPIPVYSGEKVILRPNHKYAFQSGSASQKIYLADDSDAGMDAAISGQVTCGETGASVSSEWNFRALAIGQLSSSVLSGKLVTSKNIELTPGSYLKNTGSGTCWVWDEYFG